MNFANNMSYSSPSDNSVIDKILRLLHDYSWIYNFKVTNLLSDNILENIPADWRKFLSNLSVDSFNEIFIHSKSEINPKTKLNVADDIPADVRKFLELYNSTLISFQTVISSQTDTETEEDKEETRGVSPKKRHEILRFADFIESKISRSQTVVDVGAGLGYLGEELCRREFTVIGLEASRSHVAGAGRRKTRIAGHQFETHLVRVEDSQQCRDLLLSLVPHNSCLVGLHCCGDLTSDLLKIFCQLERFSSLMVVSCCYHKMQLLPHQPVPVNFPLSSKVGFSIKKLREELELNSSEQPEELFSVYMMRLAAQETIETWLGQTEADHREHLNNLGFRACLEKVVGDLDIKLTKKKRRSLPANVNENITSYTRAVRERYHLESVEEDKLESEMVLCCAEHAADFPVIELLTGLQFLLQAVIENLITVDRLLYLQEHQEEEESKAGIAQIFSPLLSPRNKVLFVTKR